MKEFNGSAVIIRPKGPYIAWANRHSSDGLVYSPGYFEERCLVLLVPCCSEPEAIRHIAPLRATIFTAMLSLWYPDMGVWPEVNDADFGRWFEVQFQMTVMDARQ